MKRETIIERLRKMKEETVAATIAVGGRLAVEAMERGRKMLEEVILPTFEDRVLPRIRERFPALADLLEEFTKNKIEGYLLDGRHVPEEQPQAASVQEEPAPHKTGEPSEKADEQGAEAPEQPPQPAEQAAEQEGPISHEILERAFSHSQLFKVLYLMHEVEKELGGEGWMMAKDVTSKGEDTGFHIQPGNVRKVLRQKAIPEGLVAWRNKPGAKGRAREYALTQKGRQWLEERLSELTGS